VLVQHTPLAIRFRFDEKRFDVDGAYNVRYEVIKKRIDKAKVRGGSERITQPGTMAIVYSQRNEAVEYRQYLEYLKSLGYVIGEPEELDLEEPDHPLLISGGRRSKTSGATRVGRRAQERQQARQDRVPSPDPRIDTLLAELNAKESSTAKPWRQVAGEATATPNGRGA